MTDAFPQVTDESVWLGSGDQRAALPMQRWTRLGSVLTTRHSSFPFVYGGPVPRRLAATGDLLPEAVRRLRAGGAAFVLVASPFGAAADIDADAHPSDAHPSDAHPSTVVDASLRGARIERTPEITHLLRLPADPTVFWETILTAAKRNDVRRIGKKGVSVRRGGTEEDIESVYRFYRDSFRRWGGPPGLVYPLALYRSLVRRGGDAVRLYLAEHEGRILGGAFVIRWNGHVHYHAGYFDHEARALRPNVLIQETVIREAIEDRFVDYDFLPSGGNAGVEAFKEGFGGVRTPLERYEFRPPLHRLVERLRRRGRPAAEPGA
ncbi:MAG: GNAT family N-acetyltransferase, partial [Candidatus Eisenbacteria bacterium]|nr:GNAT family N-acetyltransferase [Candidatus Eisenbacteria bacterium]